MAKGEKSRKQFKKARMEPICSMTVFGTIGMFVRGIRKSDQKAGALLCDVNGRGSTDHRGP